MCHGYERDARDWYREREETAEEDDELPEFLNEEGAEDVEILTDGGDEE